MTRSNSWRCIIPACWKGLGEGRLELKLNSKPKPPRAHLVHTSLICVSERCVASKLLCCHWLLWGWYQQGRKRQTAFGGGEINQENVILLGHNKSWVSGSSRSYHYRTPTGIWGSHKNIRVSHCGHHTSPEGPSHHYSYHWLHLLPQCRQRALGNVFTMLNPLLSLRGPEISMNNKQDGPMVVSNLNWRIDDYLCCNSRCIFQGLGCGFVRSSQ